MIVNRIGDAAFLIGMFLLFWSLAQRRRSRRCAFRDDQSPGGRAGRGDAVGADDRGCLLLLIGATGKSAQIPLYIWLPDAMAGPTPVSALIHAATMVTAGVYMIARLSPLYVPHPLALDVVATIGGADLPVRRDDRARAGRPEEDPRLLDGLPDRLHDPRRRRRRVLGRHLPPDDARLLQGAAVPLRRKRDARAPRRASHLAHGGARSEDADHREHLPDRCRGDRRRAAALAASSRRT